MIAVTKILIVITFLALFSAASFLDIEEAESEANMYCEMVSEGIWPAYRTDVVCK
jgi:hypothetical protein